MIFSSPVPQLGQRRMSISNARLSSRPLRHHSRPQLRVGRQHPVVPDQVQSRPRRQCCQLLHELQWTQHQVRRSVLPRRLQLQLHLPCSVDLDALVRQRRPRDVAAQRPGHGGGRMSSSTPSPRCRHAWRKNSRQPNSKASLCETGTRWRVRIAASASGTSSRPCVRYGDRRVTAPSRALRVRAYAAGSTASRRARTASGVGSKLLPNKSEGSADMQSA